MASLDFSVNPKQAEFFNTTLMAASGKSPIRQICLGGGIRSGKSYSMLGMLTILCALYPGCRCVIYRKDMPSLEKTIIVSLSKMLAGVSTWKWNRSSGNFYVEHIPTKSRIYMFGENIDRDPTLNTILGLEINFAVLEQAEEISEDLYLKIQSRLGSYYIPNMPKPLLLMTTNPTQNWVKDKFYLPFRNNTLEPHKKFIEMNPSDNSFLTEDQKEIFEQLDDRTKQQYILGDWTDLRSKDDLFAYAFNREKHVPPHTNEPIWNGDHNNYLYLSFDFNVNPITCSVIQHVDGCIYVLEQIKLANSDIYLLCDYIKVKWANFVYMVTGDASGNNRSAMVKDALNYYKIIGQELKLNAGQFKVPTSNPKMRDNQVLVNSIFERYRVQIHPDRASHLIWDLENVRVNADGSIVKANRTKLEEQADNLDCWRYYLNTYHYSFVNMKSID